MHSFRQKLQVDVGFERPGEIAFNDETAETAPLGLHHVRPSGFRPLDFDAFAFRRRPRKLPLLLAEIGTTGATTVLVTDISASESAKAASHVIRCRCHSLAPFNSFTAAATVIDYLSWTAAAWLGERGVERFRRIDRMVELIDDVAKLFATPGLGAQLARHCLQAQLTPPLAEPVRQELAKLLEG